MELSDIRGEAGTRTMGVRLGKKTWADWWTCPFVEMPRPTLENEGVEYLGVTPSGINRWLVA